MEDENNRLTKIVADLMLNKAVRQAVIRREVICRDLAVLAWENGGNVRIPAANTGGTPVPPELPKHARIELLIVDSSWERMRAKAPPRGPFRTASIVYWSA